MAGPLDRFRSTRLIGDRISEYLQQAEALRTNRMSTPVRQVKTYANAGNGNDLQAWRDPREDLSFNPDTLRPVTDTNQSDLTITADVMRFGDFSHIGFSVGTAGSQVPVLSRPDGKRTFLLIQNTHATQSLFVGFGVQPSAAIGITLVAGGNMLLDAAVAQDDVFLAGSGAGTTGLITYCNQAFRQG